MVIDNPPFFDLLQRAKAAETGQVVVEAAISDARRLSGAVNVTHLRRDHGEVSDLSTHVERNPGFHHTGGDPERGDLRPVVSLLVTSRRTRAARRWPCADRNMRTARGLRLASSRSAHDIAFTTMSSRSSTSSEHTASVRRASPVAEVAPRDFALSGTVATNAARRRHRSAEEAKRAISRSEIRPDRQATPPTKQPKQSTSPHVLIPAARRLTSASLAAATARGAARSSSYARYLCPASNASSARASTSESLDAR